MKLGTSLRFLFVTSSADPRSVQARARRSAQRLHLRAADGRVRHRRASEKLAGSGGGRPRRRSRRPARRRDPRGACRLRQLLRPRPLARAADGRHRRACRSAWSSSPPSTEPIVLAEQIGTLAAFAEGPLIVTLALGGRAQTFGAFGREQKKRVVRLEELAGTLRASSCRRGVTLPWPLIALLWERRSVRRRRVPVALLDCRHSCGPPPERAQGCLGDGCAPWALRRFTTLTS